VFITLTEHLCKRPAGIFDGTRHPRRGLFPGKKNPAGIPLIIAPFLEPYRELKKDIVSERAMRGI
jgi:hypothetical protein